MIAFRISAKLAKTIHEYELPSFSEHDGSPYLEWYGTSFTIKRIPYIIICNMQTLLSVVVNAQGITDLKSLYETFLKHLGEVLSDLDCSLIFRRIIVPQAAECKLTEMDEIPVVTVTHQIIEKLKQQNRTVEMSAREMSIWINRNDWKQLGERTPLDIFVNSSGLGFIVEPLGESDGEAVKKKSSRKSGQ